jgi:acyl carrier protein
VLTLLNGAKDDIGDADPLMDSGIDSLGAVELRQALAARFDMVLPPTLIFDYPSIGALAKFLYESKVPAEIHGVQKIFPQRLEGHSTDIPMSESHAVEISCIACEYPRGITNLSDLVKAFLRGVEFQEIMSNERFDPETLGGGVRTATILDDIDAFDAEMFRIVDAEAVAMDPQQRKLLDISLRILTSSPIGTVEAAVGSNTAVYLGVMWTEYQQLLVDVGAPQNVSIMI